MGLGWVNRLFSWTGIGKNKVLLGWEKQKFNFIGPSMGKKSFYGAGIGGKLLFGWDKQKYKFV